MNYKYIYDSLINKRKVEQAIGYTENHHIIMRSMGGTDAKDNLVSLTGQEHWIAHLLLWKIHKNNKTACACYMMAMKCKECGIPQIRNSRMYEAVKIKYVSLMSLIGKKCVGKANGSYDTMWIC